MMENHCVSYYIHDQYYCASDFEDLLDDLSKDETSDNDCNLVCSDDSSTSGTSGKSRCIKRKPKRVRKYISIPRILTTDVRRSYASMFVNVRNSSDFRLMFGFLNTYFSPDFEQLTCKHDLFTNVPRTKVSQGVVPTAMFWYKVNTSPDAVMRMGESHVFVIPGSTRTKIITKVSFSSTCTKVYNRTAEQEMRRIKQITDAQQREGTQQEHNNKKQKCVYSHGLNGSLLEMMDAIDALNDSMPLVRQPFQVTSEGTITMYTDENKLIRRLEITAAEHKTEVLNSATEWARACGLEDGAVIHGCIVDAGRLQGK